MIFLSGETLKDVKKNYCRFLGLTVLLCYSIHILNKKVKIQNKNINDLKRELKEMKSKGE